jgi:hypothetical protein
MLISTQPKLKVSNRTGGWQRSYRRGLLNAPRDDAQVEPSPRIVIFFLKGEFPSRDLQGKDASSLFPSLNQGKQKPQNGKPSISGSRVKTQPSRVSLRTQLSDGAYDLSRLFVRP